MVTRRQVLGLGAGAVLAAMLEGVGSARATGVDATGPAYLSRSSWVPLIGATLWVAGTTVRLTEVADLQQLPGRDDAFALQLTGAAGALGGGTYRVWHSALGSFELFVSPVDTVVADVQRYEIVVDRSVGVPSSIPTTLRRHLIAHWRSPPEPRIRALGHGGARGHAQPNQAKMAS